MKTRMNWLVEASWLALALAGSPGCGGSSPGVDETGSDTDGTTTQPHSTADGTDSSTLTPSDEDCDNALDDDLDGRVDCEDADCAAELRCTEDCGNGVDDNGDLLADCDDPVCKGISPECGEICGDHADNDDDGLVDCADPDCADMVPPCGGDTTGDTDTTDGTGGGAMCDYEGTGTPHPCACDDGIDNDSDGQNDASDLQCFGPFDDDEATYATGIPGDNNGSKGNKECPFDGNSGIGNDDICCNIANPGQNVTPNGCDDKGCCEVDVNGNGTGEHVWVGGTCSFSPICGANGTHGCACGTNDDCDPGQFCIADDDVGSFFCSLCEACSVNAECENPCDCGESCFAGFHRSEEECGIDTDTDTSATGTDTQTGTDTSGHGSCPAGHSACPGGNADCNTTANEVCIGGCCYPTCPAGVTPCQATAECPTDKVYYCVTGCCIEAGAPV